MAPGGAQGFQGYSRAWFPPSPSAHKGEGAQTKGRQERAAHSKGVRNQTLSATSAQHIQQELGGSHRLQQLLLTMSKTLQIHKQEEALLE